MLKYHNILAPRHKLRKKENVSNKLHDTDFKKCSFVPSYLDEFKSILKSDTLLELKEN